jgi:hypothetical protein
MMLDKLGEMCLNGGMNQTATSNHILVATDDIMVTDLNGKGHDGQGYDIDFDVSDCIGQTAEELAAVFAGDCSGTCRVVIHTTDGYQHFATAAGTSTQTV